MGKISTRFFGSARRFTARGTTPRQTYSTTSSDSTTQCAGTRRSATSARLSLERKVGILNCLSTKPAAGQTGYPGLQRVKFYLTSSIIVTLSLITAMYAKENYHDEETFAASSANRICACHLRPGVRRIRHLSLGPGKRLRLVRRICARTGGSLRAAALSKAGRNRMSDCRWMRRSGRHGVCRTAGTGIWRRVSRR